MDILWAPWREKYVVKASSGKKKHACVFCGILKANKDKETFIFERSAHSFAVLNIYPFNGGHVLIIPKRHVEDLSDLTKAERDDLLDLLLRVKARMKKAIKPQAFNVGINLGHFAGAGIPEHVHIHMVPRWSGDVNFMPAVFKTKVIPVSLQKVYRLLKP
jgi:ATP adenylyltransferase